MYVLGGGGGGMDGCENFGVHRYVHIWDMKYMGHDIYVRTLEFIHRYRCMDLYIPLCVYTCVCILMSDVCIHAYVCIRVSYYVCSVSIQ